MEQKINVAELLKDCPKGMELNCTMFDKVELDRVVNHSGALYPIICNVKTDLDNSFTCSFDEYGRYSRTDGAKCVIFPKGKTTWEGFKRPFRDGDILAYDISSTKSTVFIYRYDNPRWNTSYFVALSGFTGNLLTDGTGALRGYEYNVRFATQEETERLFSAMKKNGYKWNAETKTLDNLTVKDFNDGDICYIKTKSHMEFIFVFRSNEETPDAIGRYVSFDEEGILRTNEFGLICGIENVKEFRFATEEEKQRLFKAIKDNGYKWNPKTKTLEELCPFKPGDVLVSGMGNIVLFSHINDRQIVYYHCLLNSFNDFCIAEKTDCGVGPIDNCKLATTEQRNKLLDRLHKIGYKYNSQTNKLEEWIEPKFKVGDRVRNTRSNSVGVIEKLTDTGYDCRFEYGYFFISFKDQHNFILVPNKFDISTLKPFDKVLIRDLNSQIWTVDMFSFYDENLVYPFNCIGHCSIQCIPYENNEHLLGTIDNCDDFYKIWK